MSMGESLESMRKFIRTFLYYPKYEFTQIMLSRFDNLAKDIPSVSTL